MYGSVALLSEICPECHAESFVVEGHFNCCGLPYEKVPDRWKRMSSTSDLRRKFSAAFRQSLITSQNDVCYWCGIPFDREEFNDGKRIKKHVHIEHIEPFIYAANEDDENIVASCSICNWIKTDYVFKDTYACKAYVRTQRILKGYSTNKYARRERIGHLELSKLRKRIQAETKMAEVLHNHMPVESLGQNPPAKQTTIRITLQH